MNIRISLTVNGESHDLLVPVHKTLLEVVREDLDLIGTKHGCELGECGTCTVLVDGAPTLSCLALPADLQESEITTVEGLADGGRLHPLQQAFAELGAAQCGYCTPGILLTAKALLSDEPTPTRQRIREALAGNLCRCTGYTKILDAVELAALRMTRARARRSAFRPSTTRCPRSPPGARSRATRATRTISSCPAWRSASCCAARTRTRASRGSTPRARKPSPAFTR